MDPVASSFGLGAIGVVLLSAVAWRGSAAQHADTLACAAMLFMTWCISNTLVALYEPPKSWLFFPIMDAICGAVVMGMWFSKPAPWKLVLTGLFVLQCCAHLAFWLQGNRSHGVMFTYAVVLNLTFCAQLLVTAWPGGTYVGSRLGDILAVSARTRSNGPTLPRA